MMEILHRRSVLLLEPILVELMNLRRENFPQFLALLAKARNWWVQQYLLQWIQKEWAVYRR